MLSIKHKYLFLFVAALVICSSFNYVQEPDPMAVNKGRKLFMAKCTNCHKLSNEKYLGPGLDSITFRQSKEEVISWAVNHKARIDWGDLYAKDLYKDYKYYAPSKSGLNDNTAEPIYEFLYFLDHDGL